MRSFRPICCVLSLFFSFALFASNSRAEQTQTGSQSLQPKVTTTNTETAPAAQVAAPAAQVAAPAAQVTAPAAQVTAPAAQVTAPVSAPSAQAAPPPPTGLAPVNVGPLEIMPAKANLVLSNRHSSTILTPTIRFKIKNTSASDVKIILFKESIEATDDLGSPLFYEHRIKGGGLLLSNQNVDSFNKAFQDEKGSFVTISPKQVFEAQLLANEELRVDDKDNEFIKTHRPKVFTFSANIGIATLDGTTDIRAFSFSDLPLHVVAK